MYFNLVILYILIKVDIIFSYFYYVIIFLYFAAIGKDIILCDYYFTKLLCDCNLNLHIFVEKVLP